MDALRRTLPLILAAAAIVLHGEENRSEPVRVILETDMTFDVDDVGALAVLHALADNGQAEILAVNFNEVHPSGAAAIDAINTFYGRGDIPIGAYPGDLPNPDKSRYLDHLARFPHTTDADNAAAAVDVYRRVLARQPDQSVTIVSVGFLNNLSDLLEDDADLVRAKVARLVVMGGRHNDGFNLVRHDLVETSQTVFEHWPTPLAISDHGGRLRTGATLASSPAENPVREAYYRWFGNAFKGRSSWDQVAVLYGVLGPGVWFADVATGTASLPNGYRWELTAGFRTYVASRRPDEELAALIERLMAKPPALRVRADGEGQAPAV